MNDDLMSRSTIKHAIYDVCLRKNNIDIFEELLDRINELPSVNPQEPKTGHWIKSRDCYGNNHFTCPFCEHDIATKTDTLGDNYCSNCGAKLQESEVSDADSD